MLVSRTGLEHNLPHASHLLQITPMLQVKARRAHSIPLPYLLQMSSHMSDSAGW